MSSVFNNADNLKLLQDLLYPQDGSGDDSDDKDPKRNEMKKNKQLTPADIGPEPKGTEKEKKKEEKEGKKENENPEKKPAKKNSILSIEDWEQENEFANLEKRKMPEYKMTYRQAVGTQDAYLKLGRRNTATASCEELILDIDLKEETVGADKMTLSITATEIDLITPIYRLKISLPHRVDVEHCRAKFEAADRRLILMLRLKRDLDFVNF